MLMHFYRKNSPINLQLTKPNERLITLHLPFVYERNELGFACPYFIKGLMLFFPLSLPFFVSHRKGTL